jgi:YD repeat-containing protein
VVTETDALGNTLTYTWNNLGKLVRSESPGVEITNEDGSTNWVRPSEDYYYDNGGRRIATHPAAASARQRARRPTAALSSNGHSSPALAMTVPRH